MIWFFIGFTFILVCISVASGEEECVPGIIFTSFMLYWICVGIGHLITVTPTENKTSAVQYVEGELVQIKIDDENKIPLDLALHLYDPLKIISKSCGEKNCSYELQNTRNMESISLMGNEIEEYNEKESTEKKVKHGAIKKEYEYNPTSTFDPSRLENPYVRK